MVAVHVWGKDLRFVRSVDTFLRVSQETDIHQVPNSLHLSDAPVSPSKIWKFAEPT